MSEDGPERSSTDVFRHLDDVAERILRQPVGTGASHRAHDVLAAPEKNVISLFFGEGPKNYRFGFFQPFVNLKCSLKLNLPLF